MYKSPFAIPTLSILQHEIYVTGRIFIIVLLTSFLFLQAEDFNHTFHADKTKPYVKEAVILTFELNQTNPNKVLIFDFDLVKSKDYTFQRLDTQETDNHPNKGLHAVHIKYVYLVYPLRSGKVNLHFNLLKKVTTDESVAYSFSGDRDNVKTLVTNDTLITLPPLVLEVKPLPHGTQIVGDFSLNYRLDRHNAKAYEPLPFQVTLKGLGYPPLLKLLPKDINFTLFTEKPLVKTQAKYNSVHYLMALSHDRNFTLPNIRLQAFNPKTQKSYILSVPKQKFHITPIAKSELIDTLNAPKMLKLDWSWLYSFLSYLLVFIAGFSASIFWKKTKKLPTSKDNHLKEKIQNCKDAKALLQVLLANDAHRFYQSIETLEKSLYTDVKISLNKVKQEVINTL